jgi:hypothetical protein
MYEHGRGFMPRPPRFGGAHRHVTARGIAGSNESNIGIEYRLTARGVENSR